MFQCPSKALYKLYIFVRGLQIFLVRLRATQTQTPPRRIGQKNTRESSSASRQCCTVFRRRITRRSSTTRANLRFSRQLQFFELWE